VDQSQSQDAKRILEINHRHPIIDELRRRAKENPEDQIAKETATLLFEVSSLQSGFSLDDTKSFSARMHRVMKQGMNLDMDAPLFEEEEFAIEEAEDEDAEDEKDEEEGADKEEVVKDEL